MEVLMLLTVALAAALAGWVLVPRSQGVHPATQGRRRRRTCLGLLARLGDTTFVDALLHLDVLSRAASLVAADARGRGVGLERPQAAACLLLACLASCVLCVFVASSALGILVGVLLCAVALPSWVAARAAARRRELAQEMPAIFRSLAAAMGAGRTLSQAVSYVGTHEEGPAAEEFGRASLELMCGTSASEALEALAGRLDAPGMGLLSCALLVSQKTGSPLGDLFLRSARLVERQGEFEQSLSVRTAQVRLSVRVVCALPVLLVACLALVSVDFREGLSTPIGLGSLVVAALLDVLALVLIRRVMREVV
ncbi:MAG: type II secretion system F family protein [Atopobiaceae bacterium]|jgi:tight adherence protein B|nr:type II secretion system F family protein [Atopobiaceae bacterium]MCH4180169.1 type II secretion system F family protein [Atopobiaceae bacterium]MCH4214339.1 type II secretion system F family protein [Atopobiaceae bacterium]MCH4276601.1 type II secretion system F family protein [Atopobiaceae bacterium]MCI1227027.1 type II secretion system F family protein [Atopobiaceae bacterium]